MAIKKKGSNKAVKRPWGKTQPLKLFQTGDEEFFYHSYSKGPVIPNINGSLGELVSNNDLQLHGEYEGQHPTGGSVFSFLVRKDRHEIQLIADKLKQGVEFIDVRNNAAIREKFLAELQEPLKRMGFDTSIFDKSEVFVDERVDKLFRVTGKLIDSEYAQRALHALRSDILLHCIDRPPKEPLEIAGLTLVKTIQPEKRFIDAKENPIYSLRLGKGEYVDGCPLQLGYDFVKGCFVNITPKGTYDPSNKCDVCYASQNNIPALMQYAVTPEALAERILELKPLVKKQGKKQKLFIRGGQITELLIPHDMKKWKHFNDGLLVLFKAFDTLAPFYDLHMALPSHTVEFDKRYVAPMKQHNVALLVSVMHKEMEGKGLFDWGFDLNTRLENARRYAQEGVNVSFYLTVDVTRGSEYFSDEVKQAIAFYEQHKDEFSSGGLLFLDYRATKKDQTELLFGDKWENLVRPRSGQFDAFRDYRFHYTGNTHLAANFVHPEIEELVGNNRGEYRLCYTHAEDPKHNRCGLCFMDVKTSKI